MKNLKGKGWLIAGGVVVLVVAGFLIFGGGSHEHDTKTEPSNTTAQTEQSKKAAEDTGGKPGAKQQKEASLESSGTKAGEGVRHVTTKKKDATEASKKKADTGVAGVWEYHGNGFTELLTFGPNGSYGYLATPEDGNEQTITGKYEVSEIGHTVTIAANEEVEELVYERDGNTLKIWDRVYKKVRDAGTGYE